MSYDLCYIPGSINTACDTIAQLHSLFLKNYNTSFVLVEPPKNLVDLIVLDQKLVNVFILEGGIKSWTSEGYPTASKGFDTKEKNYKNKKLNISRPFTKTSSSFTYILYDKKNKESVAINPICENFERDSRIVRELGLNLRYILVTSNNIGVKSAIHPFKRNFGTVSCAAKYIEMEPVDIIIEDGQEFSFGNYYLKVIQTQKKPITSIIYVGKNFLLKENEFLTKISSSEAFTQSMMKKSVFKNFSVLSF